MTWRIRIGRLNSYGVTVPCADGLERDVALRCGGAANDTAATGGGGAMLLRDFRACEGAPRWALAEESADAAGARSRWRARCDGAEEQLEVGGDGDLTTTTTNEDRDDHDDDRDDSRAAPLTRALLSSSFSVVVTREVAAFGIE